MNSLETTSLTCQFLIAMPSLDDRWFGQSVVFICDHKPASTFGIVINKLLDMQLGDLFDQMDLHCEDKNLCGVPIYQGGPINAERGFVLHTQGMQWERSYDLGNGIFLTTSKDILLDLAAGKGPKNCFIALGYASWSEGQLEHELRQNSWLNAPADETIIFHKPVDERWHAGAQLLGVDIQLISNTVGHA